MKTILFTLIFSTFSCLNQSDKAISDHIIVPTTEVELPIKPDAFIAVQSKELDPAVVSLLEEKSTEEMKTDKEIPATAKELKEGIPDRETASQKTVTNKAASNTNTNTNASSVDGKLDNTIVINKPETTQSVSDIEVPTSTGQVPKPIKEVIVDQNPVTKIVEPVTESETPKSIEAAKPVIAKPNHSSFNGLLAKYVSASGNVNYKGLKSTESKLDAYLKDLDANVPAGDWTKDEKLAYWMNAYNAFTIKLILNNYPVSKITDLHGGKPWDQKWISLGGKTYSLNDIEHTIIRPTFKDPRIHFAVNCAAKSCPPLLNKAYTGQNVDRELTKVTKAFVNSASNKISNSSVEISKIFEWYAEDFGNIIDYLNQYAAEKVDSNAKVGYLPYNWALNEG